MENQEQKPRKMIHIQVAGEYTSEDLSKIVQHFMEASLDSKGGIVATPDNVTVNNIEIPEDLSGMILTPKMTAKEVASVVVSALQGYDVGVGNQPTAAFNDLEDDAKLEILSRIQFVLRFGGLPGDDGEKLSVRDSIFVAVVNSLRNKLASPDVKNVIEVTRIAQKEGDEDEVCSFLGIRQGDVFDYQGQRFVAQSDPFINWIADPLPVVNLSAEAYVEQEPVPADEVKASAPAKKQVQSKPSKAKVHHRKK